MSAIWAVICIVVITINFISNKLINTNCRYIYAGSVIVIVGSLIGLTDRPVIAGSIVLIGLLVVMWATATHTDRRCKHKTLCGDRR